MGKKAEYESLSNVLLNITGGKVQTNNSSLLCRQGINFD